MDWEENDHDIACRLYSWLQDNFGSSVIRMLATHFDFQWAFEFSRDLSGDHCDSLYVNAESAVRDLCRLLGHRSANMDALKSLPSGSKVMICAARMLKIAEMSGKGNLGVDPNISFVLNAIL